jgi:hypothetical protein
MNEKDKQADEREDVVGQSIPINDKRRFNDKGERVVTEDEEKPKDPVKSPREVELETKLAAEMDRRLAAAAKLNMTSTYPKPGFGTVLKSARSSIKAL